MRRQFTSALRMRQTGAEVLHTGPEKLCLSRDTFQICHSSGYHWKQSTAGRRNANLKDGTCRWFPPLCADRKQAGWFTDKNKKVPLCLCWRRRETVRKQDTLPRTGAHLLKVMARKIWMSLKGNGGYKAIIHSLSDWHCYHNLKGWLLLFPSGQKTVKLTCARWLYPMSIPSIRSFFFSSAFARCGIVVFAAQAVTARPLSHCNISSGSICWNQIYDFSSKRHINPIGDWGTANHSVKKATAKK